jgi:hypothetical protein
MMMRVAPTPTHQQARGCVSGALYGAHHLRALVLTLRHAVVPALAVAVFLASFSPTARTTKPSTKEATKLPTKPASKLPTKAPTTPQPTQAFACTSLTVDLHGFINLNVLGINGGMTFLKARTFLRSSPAMSQCCNQRAHLASISGPTENARFQASIRPFTLANALIGLNNLANPPNYTWDGSTEAVTYTKWCGPDRSDCPCGRQHPFFVLNSCAGLIPNSGYWFNYECNTATFDNQYDCEPPGR